MTNPDEETTEMIGTSIANRVTHSVEPFVCRCSACIREYAARVHKKTESLCQKMYTLFTRHPHEKQTSYAHHALHALRMALHMGKGAIGLCIHSIFPFLCEKTGTRTVDKLHAEMHDKRVLQ